jgi:spore maturation protein CgeB
MKLTYKLQRPRPRAWLDERLQPPIYDDAYFRLTRESAVTVGINRYPDFRHAFWSPGSYSRLRDIEAPMLGACYLTEDCPGLDQLYEPGVEIETYRTAGELAEKSRALLADPTRRRELRTRAQRRALSEHTIARSLDKIFAALNLPKTS